MKWGKKGSCVIVFCCVASLTMSAQSREFKFPFEFGLHAGGNIYQGDLTPSPIGSYRTIDFTTGAHANAIISDAFSLRATYNYGKLRGDDAAYNNSAWRRQRNLKFTATQREYSFMVVWDIFAQNKEITTPFAPYLFAGLGYTSLKIERDYSKFNRQYFVGQPSVIAGLDADLAQPLPKGMRVIPFGIGIRHPITNVISVKFETCLRLSSTDYLDGFSNAADTKQTDHYHSHVIGLIFSPGKTTRDHNIPCPKM